MAIDTTELIHTITIYTRQQASSRNDYGHLVVNYNNFSSGTTKSCRVDHLSEETAMFFGGEYVKGSILIFMNAPVTLSRGDVISWQSRKYEVREILELYADSSTVHHYEVMAVPYNKS